MAETESGKSPSEDLPAELRFRLLVESVKDYAIFMLDVRGHVVTWNIGAERIKGYRPEEIIGQHFSRFYPEEDVRAGKPAQELVDAARDGRFEDEGWRIRKDGTLFWANVVITALRDGKGTLVGFAKVTRDLTERRRAEEQRIALERETAAREAEREARILAEKLRAELATTLRSIGDAVIATDERGAITMMNHVAESLTGWPEAEARGRPLAEVFRIINEHTRATVVSPVDKVLELGVVVGLANHTLLVARDGREIPIDDSGAPIRRHGAPTEGVVLVFRDVSERKVDEWRRSFLAEVTATLAESLDYEVTVAKVAQLAVPRLADWCAVDIALDRASPPRRLAVAHVDPAKVQLASDVHAKYPPRPDAPRGVPHVIRTGQSELYATISEDLLVASAVDEEHLRLARSLGLRSAMIVPLVARGRVLGALSFVFAESGRTYTDDDLQFADEVAHRCALAIDNARLYASEQSARRNADVANRAKDEFLAMVSHELRTPLNAILGWAKMLTRAPDFDDERRERGMATIERNAVAMAQLIDDLLDMSRIITGKMRLDVQQVHVARCVEAALEAVRPAAEAKGIRVEAGLDASIAITADPTRLQQIVWNLLSNAVKFTPQGGRVDVLVRRGNTHIEVQVADTGRGITPRFLPYVFDPFRQEDATFTRSRGGLGLGLAITRQLVELHGGTIEARSEGEGRGASFIVCLPVSMEHPAEASSGSPTRHARSVGTFERPPQLRGLRVLAVDDEPDSRLLVKEILEDCGCVVTVAGSVEEALDRFARQTPDVLLADVAMPERDGYDLIRAVRALPRDRGGDVPAAALTAYTRAEDRRQLLHAGYSMHLGKPFDPAELVAVVVSLTRFMVRAHGPSA